MQSTKKIQDLNLLLMYLSGWEEDITAISHIEVGSSKSVFKKRFRFWKGFLFDVLNDLREDGMIQLNHNTKSGIMTEEGIERAKKLKSIVMSALGDESK